jgi:hypothetical protein
MQTTANLWALFCRDFPAFQSGALRIYKCLHESDDPKMRTVIASDEALLREAL